MTTENAGAAGGRAKLRIALLADEYEHLSTLAHVARNRIPSRSRLAEMIGER